jgi:hypothetical protein
MNWTTRQKLYSLGCDLFHKNWSSLATVHQHFYLIPSSHREHSLLSVRVQNSQDPLVQLSSPHFQPPCSELSSHWDKETTLQMFHGESISTPHLQTPLFIKSSIRIALILLRSSLYCYSFCTGHFNPFKIFFLLWIWTMTIICPDVKT